MRTLAIETATEACSIALFEADELVAHDHREIGRGHAERLVPMIADLPDKGRADRILVSLGPGSFTGVRIGIATARALGFAWGSEVVGYPTLALIASMAQARQPGPVTVCMNGGHGEWFVQPFADNVQPVREFASLPPELAAVPPAPVLIAGNKASAMAELYSEHGRPTALDCLPDARRALALPEPLLTDSLSPIYGRAPDAKPQAAPAKAAP